jgi:hypothetical protein
VVKEARRRLPSIPSAGVAVVDAAGLVAEVDLSTLAVSITRAGSCNDRCFRIVDPASGTIVGRPQTALTTQLVGL